MTEFQNPGRAMKTGPEMPVRVGINGFGRMGRLAFRAAFGNPSTQIVQINELQAGPDTAAHLLEFDSVHGRWRDDGRRWHPGQGARLVRQRTGLRKPAGRADDEVAASLSRAR